MALIRQSSRQPSRMRSLLIAAVLLINLLGLGLEAISLSLSRKHYEARAVSLTQNLAYGVERAVSGNVAKIDLVLQGVTDELQQQLTNGPLREEAVAAVLERHLQRVPELDAIRVSGADGKVWFGRGVNREAPASWADRDFFKIHQSRHDAGLLVSHPLLGRVSGKWQISFNRRFNYPDGRFAGVVAAPVTLDFLTALLSTLDVGPRGVVILRDEQLAVIARYPAASRAQANPRASEASPELRQAIAAGAQLGTFNAPLPADGVWRKVSFRRLTAVPFIAIVGVAGEDYLAAWWGEVAKAAIVQLGLLSITLLAAVWWWRMFRALKDSEALRAAVLDGVPNAIVVGDPEGRIILFNPGAEQLLGYQAEEVVGQASPDLFHDPDELAERAKALSETLGEPVVPGFNSIVARLRAGETVDEGEWTFVAKDGRHIPVWLSINALRDTEGELRGYLGVASDISRRKEIEQELVRAKEAAEAASQAKSRFLATISHEIRTPMNGILGMAQLLQLPGLSEAERQDYASTIVNSGNTLLALLNDVLDLSRVEAGKFQLREDAYAPEAILTEIAALFAGPAAAKGLRLEAAWQGEAGARYRGDALRLRQMLSNLVSNAVKFTAEGVIQIVAREVPGEGSLEFAVIDSGPGIAQEQQRLLFRPFSQVDSSFTRSFGGSGLGLSIVRHLAELMGGRVGVESAAGAGARFWFRLPLVRAAAQASAEDPALAAAGNGLVLPRGQGHIMVVEDNATSRRVIEELLSRQGFRVSTAFSGETALEKLRQAAPDEQPDLVLMDCYMPGLDGWETTRRLRQWEVVSGVPRRPVVALTGAIFPEDEARCRAAGMDDFLAKPVDVAVLQRTVAHWLPGAYTSPLPGEPPSAIGGDQAGGEMASPTASGTTSNPSATPPFDADNLLVRYGQDREMAGIAVSTFLADGPEDLNALGEALAGTDGALIVRQAHTLAGSAGAVSGLALAALARQVEDLARDGELALARQQKPNLEAAARQLEQALQDFLEAAPV